MCYSLAWQRKAAGGNLRREAIRRHFSRTSQRAAFPAVFGFFMVVAFSPFYNRPKL